MFERSETSVLMMGSRLPAVKRETCGQNVVIDVIDPNIIGPICFKFSHWISKCWYLYVPFIHMK